MTNLQANVINQNCDGGIFKISGSPCEIKSQSIPIRLTSTGSASESTDSSNSPTLLTPPLNSPRIKELKYLESRRSTSVSSDESVETDLAESPNNFDIGGVQVKLGDIFLLKISNFYTEILPWMES